MSALVVNDLLETREMHQWLANLPARLPHRSQRANVLAALQGELARAHVFGVNKAVGRGEQPRPMLWMRENAHGLIAKGSFQKPTNIKPTEFTALPITATVSMAARTPGSPLNGPRARGGVEPSHVRCVHTAPVPP